MSPATGFQWTGCTVTCPPYRSLRPVRFEEADPNETKRIEKLKNEKKKRDAELLKQAREQRRKQEETPPRTPAS